MSSDRKYIDGPWNGRPVEIKAGWPDPDIIRHELELPNGEYRRGADGLYRWHIANFSELRGLQ